MSDKPSKPFVLASPQEYFHNLLLEAAQHIKEPLSEIIHVYLVNLLSQFLRSSDLFEIDKATGQKTTGTLAELYLKATSDPNKTRTDLLKRLGDISLYIGGFFGDSLNRKLIDIDYYAKMGESAYHTLSQNIKETELRLLYKTLSQKMMPYIDLLSFISHKTSLQKNADVLRLYERYLRTGSQIAKEELHRLGIVSPADKKNGCAIMFNLGFIEVVVILSIALVVIGPKQLPELARLVAKLLNEFRRATEDVTKGFSSPSSPLKTHDIEKKHCVLNKCIGANQYRRFKRTSSF